MRSFMQLCIGLASLIFAGATFYYAAEPIKEERNARLVDIGVGVLRTDPNKDPQLIAARKWALDLIDANAGGVKFSTEARAALLESALGYDPTDLGPYTYADEKPGPKSPPQSK
jgi:hypothetical protein